MNDVHLDDELLAGLALGDEEMLPQQRRHLEGCDACAATLGELEQLRTDVAEADPRRLLVPGPGLLGRIHAELADEQAAPDVAPAVAPAPHAPARPTRRPNRWRALVAVAAAVGLVAGVGATAAWDRFRAPSTELLASTALDALPGSTGGGSAELVRDGSTDVLRVQVSAPTPPSEFRELWLINTDGRRMVALGVLDASGRGSYPLPPVLTGDLHGYVVVDVSAEPFDGDAAHSHHSIVRGQLP